MFRRYSVNYALISIGLDAILICMALALATYLRSKLGFLPFAAYYPNTIPTPWIVYLVFAFEWIATMLLFSVYDARKNLNAVNEFTSITLASLMATVAMAGTLYLSFRLVSRLLFLSFVIVAYLLILIWHGLSRMITRAMQGSLHGRRKILIIGAGTIGREIQSRIQQTPELPLHIFGFLDDDAEKRSQNHDILGSTFDAEALVAEQGIDDVILALPQTAYKRINEISRDLLPLPVKVWVIPDYFRLALHQAAVENFAGIPMLDLRAPALNDYQRLFKRAFDLMIVLITLPIALPLMGLIALSIYLEDRDGVIFSQERAGENGHIFKMHKFRTMIPAAEEKRPVMEAEQLQGQFYPKKADDPRVTRVGRILRRTSLDELPQLGNVLKGEMSLVGPRPEQPFLVDLYEPWQRQRFAVPQGITGWWQINGRSDKPMHLNTEDDLYYVQNYSILLDLYILLKTIPVVMSGKGAF